MVYNQLLRIYLLFHWKFQRIIINILGKKTFKIHPKNVFNFRYPFFVENVNKNSNVIDIACGIGLIAYHVSKKAKKVVGIDYNPSNIDICRKQFSKKNLSYILANIQKIYYEKIKSEFNFNTAIFSHILEHIKDVPSLLKKINAEHILICVPSQENWETQLLKFLQLPYKKDQGHFREYTRKMLTKELKEAGYHPDTLSFNSEGEIVCKASRND